MKKRELLTFYLSGVLLLLAYQFLPRYIGIAMNQSWVSDFWYYTTPGFIMIFLTLLAIWLLKRHNKWTKIRHISFRWRYLFLSCGIILVNILWSAYSFSIFGPTENAVTITEFSTILTGWTALFLNHIFPVVTGPICEEIVYRALMFSLFEKGKSIYLDVVVSAIAFSLLHTLFSGFSLGSFMIYFISGLLYGICYRSTKSIAWPIMAHMGYNGILDLLSLIFP